MSRAHHNGAGEPSQRMLRVAELIRHAFSNILTRGVISDPILETQVITAPRVKMSPDLKLATIYVMPLGGGDCAPIIAALDRHRAFLRGEIARAVNLKFAPEIRFKVDDYFEKAARIDAILASDKVRRDLEPRDETPQAQEE